MKSYLIFNIDTNEIYSKESRSDDSSPLPATGFAFLEIFGEPESIDNYYIKNNQIKIKTKQPDELFKFNILTEEWEYSLELYNIKIAQQTELNLLKRLGLLTDSDWTDTLSAKTRLGDALYQAWQDYRQALRDITLQPDYPLEVIWPIAP